MQFKQAFDKIWHQSFNKPYKLHVSADHGRGEPVVLLHGIGRDGGVWQPLINELDTKPYRVIALDLLGFGKSPKPDWPAYNIDDHAQAVIATLSKLRLQKPCILVGHSMGCLIAVRVARLRPDIASHLVLYEMPLYEGLPDKRRYQMRLNFYFALYNRIIAYKPGFSREKAKLAERLAVRVGGLHVTRQTWQPFIKSLKNTIMRQTAADDIKHIKVPLDVIYGSRDRLVIRGKTQIIFGKDTENIVAHTIRERHAVSPKSAKFIALRITAAIEGDSLTPSSV